MPPFLFKVISIVICFLIWKTVVGSFLKAKKAIDEGSHDLDDGQEDKENTASRELIERENKWRQAAKQISCTFDPGTEPHGNGFAIAGRYSGHEVAIKRFGRNYVRYFVRFRSISGICVGVVRDKGTIAERMLDGRPIFPSRMFFPSSEPVFYCSAESEEAFDRFLSIPSNRSAVLNLVHLYPSFLFNTGGITVRLRASTPDVSVIDNMIAIAKSLENPSLTPMRDLTTEPKIRPASVVPVDAAPKTMKSAVVRISSEEPVPAEPAEPESLVEAAGTAASSADSLSVESVCEKLFSKSFPGMEERAAFDAMKGRRVCWCGELLTVMSFGMDFVFGSRKGVKGTFLIRTMKQGQSGFPVRIKAVAAFPPELQSGLASAKGKTLEFEGELLKFEPFAHEIYLQDASLKS